MINDDEKIERLMDQVSSKRPDLLEVRIDKVRNSSPLKEIIARKFCPAIATDRSNRKVPSKLAKLESAAGIGFDFVDLDLLGTDAEAVERLRSKGAEIILSYHDYSGTPSQDRLSKVLEAEKKLGCDICKIVSTARLPEDNLTVLRFIRKESSRVKLVSFAMGVRGVPSRVLSPWFGAEFTFASLSDEARTAEGQLSIDALRSAWQILGLQ